MIREATKDDREVFAALVLAMLTENHAGGGEYLPTERNVAWYMAHFDAYLSGQLGGVALLAFAYDGAPIAMLLWGSVGESPLDTTWGRFAVGHGTYVVPAERRSLVATRIRDAADPLLRDRGFDSVVGSAVMENEAGIRSGLGKGGFKLHGIVGVRRLA